MSKVEKDIPLATDGGRWHKQCGRSPGLDPLVSEAAQGFVSRRVPVCRQELRLKPSYFEGARNLAFNGNKIFGLQIGLEIYKGFNRGESQGS